jgi:hypothetical protein
MRAPAHAVERNRTERHVVVREMEGTACVQPTHTCRAEQAGREFVGLVDVQAVRQAHAGNPVASELDL